MTLAPHLAEIRRECTEAVQQRRKPPLFFVVVPNPELTVSVSPPYRKASSVAKRYGAPSREHTAVASALAAGAEQVCILNPIAIVSAIDALDDARHVLTAIAFMEGETVTPELATRASRATLEAG